jgi:hypothetical protein
LRHDRFTVVGTPAATEVEQRPLTDYDKCLRAGTGPGDGGGVMLTRTKAIPVKDLTAEIAYLTRR